MGHWCIVRHRIRIVFIGVYKHQSVFRRQDIPDSQVSHGRSQLTIVIVPEVLEYVLVKKRLLTPGKKPCLIVISLLNVILNGIFNRCPLSDKGCIALHKLMNPFLHCFRAEVLRAAHLYKQRRPNGAVHLCLCLRVKLMQRQKQHILSGSEIHILARRVIITKQMDYPTGCRHGATN